VHSIRPARPTDNDRAHAATRVINALDAGRIDIEEAGRHLATTYRARSRDDLHELVRHLPPDRSRAVERASSVRAAAPILFFAIIAAILLVVMLHGIDPLDTH